MRKVSSITLMMTVGVSIVPAAVLAATLCNSSSACGVYENTYSSSSGGVAIHGEANSGVGVRGTSVSNTGFYGASASGTNLAPGVEGESTASSGFGAAGGFGLASQTGGSPPFYGITAYGSIGIYSETEAAGTTTGNAGYGIWGNDTYGGFNQGVFGQSAGGTGGLFASDGGPSLGFYGNYPIGVYGVSNRRSGEAFGVVGESSYLPLYAQNSSSNAYVGFAYSTDYLYGGGGSGSFSITTSGNETLSGTLTTSKSTYVATRGGSGAMRRMYGSRSAAPEIEDVGEAQLVNGRAAVAIDAGFADSVDMRRPYHVFVTPEGDANLYLAAKTPSGFIVRETHGGRSTLAFEYRIVAKPLDEDGGRLVAMRPEQPELPHAKIGRLMPKVLSPTEQLRRKLGAAGYAKAIADLRARLAGR